MICRANIDKGPSATSEWSVRQPSPRERDDNENSRTDIGHWSSALLYATAACEVMHSQTLIWATEKVTPGTGGFVLLLNDLSQ